MDKIGGYAQRRLRVALPPAPIGDGRGKRSAPQPKKPGSASLAFGRSFEPPEGEPGGARGIVEKNVQARLRSAGAGAQTNTVGSARRA